jgi:Zn-dependent protease/CBS domain-containing protein
MPSSTVAHTTARDRAATMRGVRLGRVFDIPVRLDWSVLAIFGLVTWSLSAAVYPALAPGYATAEYWAAGIATAALFFASLLAHELSHSVVARRLGIGVRDITLWLFGGVSTIEGEAHSPHDEMKVALAGPAMSFAIALGGISAAGLLAALGAPPLLTGAALWLGAINVVLAVFNLIPAAPLDGGRVLHAWLWRRSGSRWRAGVTAARAGRAFGWVLVAVGLLEFSTVDGIGGLWLVVLGWFLLMAARAEETQARLSHDLGGVRVQDVMTADPITVDADTSVATVLGEYVLRHHCSAFPVVGPDGSLRGLVTLGRVRTVPPAMRATTRVGALAWPLAAVSTARPDELLLEVLRRPSDAGDGRVLVLLDGKLVGIVSPTDVARAVQVAELAHAS